MLKENINKKCDFCSEFEDIKEWKKDEPTEEIFYDSKDDKYILILEQFRYEYATLEINNCPLCGRRLKE